jgi:hypothetical protein
MKAIIISVLISLAIVSLEIDIRSSLNNEAHSIDMYEFKNSFKVSISPDSKSKDQLKISWSDNEKLDKILIFENGHDDLIREIKINNQKEITVSDLQNGMYEVQFFYTQNLLATHQIKINKE